MLHILVKGQDGLTGLYDVFLVLEGQGDRCPVRTAENPTDCALLRPDPDGRDGIAVRLAEEDGQRKEKAVGLRKVVAAEGFGQGGRVNQKAPAAEPEPDGGGVEVGFKRFDGFIPAVFELERLRFLFLHLVCVLNGCCMSG